MILMDHPKSNELITIHCVNSLNVCAMFAYKQLRIFTVLSNVYILYKLKHDKKLKSNEINKLYPLLVETISAQRKRFCRISTGISPK